jgi:hypothetical protein
MREQIRIPCFVWKDKWFLGLSDTEKLLFLYLLTNRFALMCGRYYGLTIKTMRVDTGLEKEEIVRILEKFKKEGKVFFNNEFIEIPNSIHFYDNEQQERLTTQYKEWRKSVFERDGYRCCICGKVGGKLHAHHIKEFSKHPELRVDVSNGITYCEGCHKESHKKIREGRK